MKQHEPATIEEIVWTPGTGPDAALLHNLAGVFPKPNIPLGEAWFMGETRDMCDDLNSQGIEGTSNENISDALDELISGLMSFPELDCWAPWYGYLAPRILSSPRFVTREFHDSLCIGLVALSLRSPNEYATRYEADFAAALSPWTMQPVFWSQGRYLPLQGTRDWRDSCGSSGIDYDVATSLLLTWRYLAPQSFQRWLHSVLAMDDALWRAHFLVWLLKLWPIFEQQVSNYAVLSECGVRDFWPEFYKIDIHFQHKPENPDWNLIPPHNIRAFQNAIRDEFTQEYYSEWIDQFSNQPELWPQMELWLEQLSIKFL